MSITAITKNVCLVIEGSKCSSLTEVKRTALLNWDGCMQVRSAHTVTIIAIHLQKQ